MVEYRVVFWLMVLFLAALTATNIYVSFMLYPSWVSYFNAFVAGWCAYALLEALRLRG